MFCISLSAVLSTVPESGGLVNVRPKTCPALNIVDPANDNVILEFASVSGES